MVIYKTLAMRIGLHLKTPSYYSLCEWVEANFHATRSLWEWVSQNPFSMRAEKIEIRQSFILLNWVLPIV